MTVGLVLTYIVIVAGGLLVGSRLRMLGTAVAFWVTFAASLGMVAIAGHGITARWHVGPVTGLTFWWVVVTSPEILIFLFFMITDPKTTPAGRTARVGYGIAVGFFAALLTAPAQSEFATKVAVLAGLAVVCALRPALARFRQSSPAKIATRPAAVAVAAGIGAILLVVAGIPARTPTAPTQLSAASRAAAGARPVVPLGPRDVPHVAIDPAVQGISTPVTAATAQRMGRDVVADLVIESDALKSLSPHLAATAAVGVRLATIEREITGARRAGRIVLPTYRVEALTVVVKRATPQSSPQVGLLVRAKVHETTYAGTPPSRVVRERDSRLEQSFLLVEVGGHFLIAG